MTAQTGSGRLTEVEEDEFGLDGRTQFDDDGDGGVDEQQPHDQPPQLRQQAQPGQRDGVRGQRHATKQVKGWRSETPPLYRSETRLLQTLDEHQR